jgi:hypothetical protein
MRDWRDELNWFNQINETNQINQTNKTDALERRAGFFSILSDGGM